jgi:hypothetical protein
MRAEHIKDRFEMRMIGLTQEYLMELYESHIGYLSPVSLLSRREKEHFNSCRLMINQGARGDRLRMMPSRDHNSGMERT